MDAPMVGPCDAFKIPMSLNSYNYIHFITIMALSKYTILVADYIPTDMLLFNILLKQAHCRLLTATDASTTLTLAKAKRPDLILLDVNMPGLNGFEVAKRLQKDTTTSQIPILYIIDMGDYPVFTPDNRVLHCEEYIEKPYDMRQLVERILQRLEDRNIKKEVTGG